MTADHRSAHPNIPGVPWWGAVLIAATLTAIGFAYDAGSGAKELSAVFAGTYIVGCILAVLAVRQAGIFTAVIQPPLLLFACVPTAYFLFTGSQLSNLKDTLINCAYPLIERFPLMFFTSAVVLLIGMARWYTGMSSRRGTPRLDTEGRDERRRTGVGGDVQGVLAVVAPRRTTTTRSTNRRAAEAPTQRPSRSTRAATIGGNRAADRTPLHTLAVTTRAPSRDRDHRTRGGPAAPTPPQQAGRATDRTTPQAAHIVEPATGHTAADRSPHRIRAARASAPLRRGRAAHGAGSNGNGTHHPISRVRYRGEDNGEEPADYRPAASGRTRDRQSKPGSTTSDPRYERAGRISLGSAKTSVSLAVVTGCTTS